LCEGTTAIHDLLDSDDTRVMLEALRVLGCGVERVGASSVHITGLGGQLKNVKNEKAALFLGNAGTAMRPLTAALAVLGGDFELSGIPRMHQRPIGDLVDALRQLGCHIDYLGTDGYPPLRIGQPHLQINEAIRVRGDVSSQFLTALLMALPLVAHQQNKNIVIDVVGELISRPYIDITLKLLARFGADVQRDGWQRFTIPAGCKLRSPETIYVEADASSASYFIALGAIATGVMGATGDSNVIRIQGVGADSIQGDIRFVEAAEQMGAVVQSGANYLEVSRGSWPLKAIDLDCNHIPDAAMTLAVRALYAEGTTTLRNIASWRVKETDRIAAMATELRKLGATVVEGHDFIQVTPPATPADWRSASIHTYDDHRVAMCFSLAAFNPAQVTVRIEDPKCVAKTFPDYFETLFSVAQLPAERIPVLCIDGPTASGKGTLTNAVAQRLGYHVLDSGALYRIVGLVASRAGLMLETLDGHVEDAIVSIVKDLSIRFESERVWLDGASGDEDITDAIRTEENGMNASRVSALAGVRAALVDLQHRFRQLPGLVADGRDMGTVIFPQAQRKIFLTASAEKRAQRRYNQLISKGITTTLDSLCADLQARDARDTSRAVAPLKPAEDAILLDNSDLSVEESVQIVLARWNSGN
jgi:3-phosphoshikimate 1-carboxyvinyltransferase